MCRRLAVGSKRQHRPEFEAIGSAFGEVEVVRVPELEIEAERQSTADGETIADVVSSVDGAGQGVNGMPARSPSMGWSSVAPRDN